MSFAGSIDIGYKRLHTLLHSITFSLMQHGARRVSSPRTRRQQSCHRQNRTGKFTTQAASVPASTGEPAGQLDPSLKGGHGDILETSAMMAVDPQAVQLQPCQPMNSHAPSANTDCASIQMISFHGGSVRLPRDTCEMRPADGLVLATCSIRPLPWVSSRPRGKLPAEFIEEFRSFPWAALKQKRNTDKMFSRKFC